MPKNQYFHINLNSFFFKYFLSETSRGKGVKFKLSLLIEIELSNINIHIVILIKEFFFFNARGFLGGLTGQYSISVIIRDNNHT